jgi:hypothetical protein
MLKAGHLCDVISVVAELMVDVAGVEPWAMRDAISVVTECMVDVAGG